MFAGAIVVAAGNSVVYIEMEKATLLYGLNLHSKRRFLKFNAI